MVRAGQGKSTRSYLKNKIKAERAEGMAQVAESCLIPSTIQGGKKERENSTLK
jgi:hypothetical protein